MSIDKQNLKFTLKTELFPILIIVTTIIIALVAHPLLPQVVISHWNAQGVADGWSSRNFHTIFFPALIAFIYLVLNITPAIDPNKKRYQEFFKTYLIIRNTLLFSLLVIFTGATYVNLGHKLNIGGLTGGTIGLLFIVMGNYLGKVKKNWFVGIKNPWTLSSDNVWNRTHRLSGKLFVIFGFIMIALPWLNSKLVMPTIIAGSIILVASLTIFSYIIFKKEQKNEKRG